ncbi:hypothetical protein VNO77_07540 [Canavalia gladiata]|uniref:Uncharacterized protein n=1 Tax=Canavalia gladiata TaxID=3824 RepID=A0AAN9QWP1_CANGL
MGSGDGDRDKKHETRPVAMPIRHSRWWRWPPISISDDIPSPLQGVLMILVIASVNNRDSHHLGGACDVSLFLYHHLRLRPL